MEIVVTADGSPTCRSEKYGQCFHSESGAVQEARERYAAACRIRELAEKRGIVTILDVGFGLGYNLAAALEAAGKAAVRAYSIEYDEEVLEFVDGFDGPEEFSRFYPIIRFLAKKKRYTSGVVDLRLISGRAEEVVPELPEELVFDAVFLDPFTPKVNPELWSAEFLREIARRMDFNAILSTYSSATEVKVNMLDAGLKIGKGAKVGDKGTGTLASPGVDLPPFSGRDVKKLNSRLARKRNGGPEGPPHGSSAFPFC